MIKSFLAVSLTLVALPLFGSPTRLNGEAVVRSIAPDRVAIFVDTTGDRVIDHGFLLSADIPTGSGLAVHLASAEVEYSDGYVRVAAADGRFYDMVVAGYPDPPKTPADSRVVTLIGYSIVHSSGDSGCTIEGARGQDAGICYAYGRE
ncbi:MAG TPA: hypothetical protein VF701_16250 [Thermoanaerobaculia bacterium]